MTALFEEIRHAIRVLLRAPGFTAAAVLSLALGIGANSAIFTLLDAAFLRALPVARPAELVRVTGRLTDGGVHSDFSYPLYAALRDGGAGLSGLAASSERSLGLSAGDRTERVNGEYVSANYFAVLGLACSAGTGLTPGDDQPGAAPVAVIGHGLSRRLFGKDPDPGGRTIRLNGRVFTVVGVAPPSFRGLVRGFPSEVWIPLSQYGSAVRGAGAAPLLSDPHTSWLSLFGRLGTAVPRAQAAAELTQVMRRFDPEESWAGIALATAASGDDSLVEELGRPLWLLFGAVGLVLAIACANVANLLLVRGQARRKELAVRAALGASRRRLLTQQLTESLLLAVAGGAVGLLFAWWAADLSSTLRIARNAVRLEPSVNGRVLAFTFALSLLTALVFGLLPALRAQRMDLVQVLKDGAAPLRRWRALPPVRDLLVAGQVTLCVVLLVGAGLFLRTLWNLRSIETGFAGDDVLAVSLNLQLDGSDEARGRRFYEQAVERVTGLPGVAAVSLATALPVTAGGTTLQHPGEVLDPPVSGPVAIDLVAVAPRFFETLGLPLRGGREFRDFDRRDSARVTVINETMARRFWPDGDAVGRSFFDGDVRHTVVGVARDTKYRDLREPPRLTMYIPLTQDYAPRVDLLVRTAGPPEALLPALRQALAGVDPTLPVFNARTLAEHVGRSLAVERLQSVVLAAFGSLALLLAAVGIYGVMAYRVARRTRELGVRMALGAGRRDLLLLVLRHGLGLAGAGIGAGVLLAFWLSRGLESRLYGVQGTDLPTFTVAVAVLLAAATLAALLPARRATRVDPLAALRCE